jgi:hypothetical protein
VTAIQNMYSAGLKRVWLTDIISTDSQKAVIIEEVYRSGVNSDEVSSQDRMPRSNGVVKSLASYKTFSDEIKDSEADIEEATYRYRRPAAHSRRCLDINVTILCNFTRAYEIVAYL